jgi:hypothetical protein
LFFWIEFFSFSRHLFAFLSTFDFQLKRLFNFNVFSTFRRFNFST